MKASAASTANNGIASRLQSPYDGTDGFADEAAGAAVGACVGAVWLAGAGTTCSCWLTTLSHSLLPGKARGSLHVSTRGSDDASDRLFRPAAEIVDQAYLTARLAGETGVAAMQDQPVMRVQHEFFRNDFFETKFDFKRRMSWRE